MTDKNENNLNSSQRAHASTTWSWFDDDGSLKCHELQTVLDSLAYAENIGIRLLDWTALDQFDISGLLSSKVKRQLDQASYDYAEALELFCAEIFSESECERSISVEFTQSTPYQWMSDQERKIWPTLPSNPLPIYSLFSMNKEWCWFVLIWLYAKHHKIEACANNNEELPAFGIDAWEYRFRWVTLRPNESRRYLLMFGPTYKSSAFTEPHDLNMDERFIIERFVRFYERVCGRSRTGLSDTALMQRMLLSRLPLLEKEISRRIDKVMEAFNAISTTLMPQANYCYRFSDFTTLSRTYISVFRAAAELAQLAGAAFPCSLQLYFPLSPHKQSSNKPDNTKSKIALFQLDISLEKKSAVYSVHCKQGKWPVENRLVTCDENSPYLSAVYQDGVRWNNLGEINRHISRWEERIAARRQFFQNLCGDMLHSWLQDHLGELLEGSPDAANLYEHICGAIVDDLRADLCHLYRYKHHDNSINLLGGAYRNDFYTANKAALRKQMEKITAHGKTQSSVYRCIQKGKMVRYETAQTDGRDNFLRESLPDEVKTQSSLVTPMLYMGRIFGAIEISGSIPYQLSWTHEYTLSNIESILGEYLYHQQLLFSLKEITRLALSKRQTNDATQLCRVLSEIFLCKDATILLKNKIHTGAFALYGSTKADLFEGHHRDMHGGFLVEGKTGCLSMLRNKYLSGENFYVVSDEPTCDEPFAQHLRDSKLLCNMTFALTRSTLVSTNTTSTRRTEDFLGAVMLHSDLPWKDDKKWQTIMHVINGQLVVALDQLNALYDEHQDNQLLARHEIMLGCKVLQEIPDKARVSLKALLAWRNAREKQIREDQSLLHVNEATWSQRYQKLAESFYGRVGEHLMRNKNGELVPLENPFLPDLVDLAKRLENMAHRANILKETVRIYESVREGEVGIMAHLFGGAPDLESLTEKLDLRSTIMDIHQAKRKAFEEKGLYFSLEVPYGVLLNNVHSQMINHWLGNMLDNGGKYTILNTGYNIRLEPRKERSYQLIFENKGLPLSVHEFPHSLFERGTRSKSARKNLPENGLGLGLYAAKVICNYLNIGYRLEYRPLSDKEANYRFVFAIPASRITLESTARTQLR